MNREEFEILLDNGETSWLDWKRDFPRGVLEGRQSKDWANGRGELLRDLVAIANGNDGHPKGYLVYGVKDLRTKREVVGISRQFDDADFQVWADNAFFPRPVFAYCQIAWTQECVVGVFEVARVPEYPHVPVQDVGEQLRRGQVWYRIGSKNEIAARQELSEMFKAEEPFKIAKTGGPVVDKIREHYAAQGEELAFPQLADRDAKLVLGWRIAYYPGTRREIWAGAIRNEHQHIAMLRPKVEATA